MLIETGIIKFSDNAEQELSWLSTEMRLQSILSSVEGSSNITPELKSDLQQMLITLSDIFSVDLPTLESNPLDTIAASARDFKLGRLLRERGTARFVRLVTSTVKSVDTSTGELMEIPFYMNAKNPSTGAIFADQEEFIVWFCHEAGISRPHIFNRIKIYNRLADIGIAFEEAWKLVISKPWAIQKTLEDIGVWDKGKLVDIHPGVADRLAEKMMPEASANDVKEMSLAIREEDNDTEREAMTARINDVMRPALADLVREVAGHESTKDALDFVNYDIIGKPEINYRWDYDADGLVVEYVRKAVDVHGTRYVAEIIPVLLVPENVVTMPSEVRDDLMKRLPVKNREKM